MASCSHLSQTRVGGEKVPSTQRQESNAPALKRTIQSRCMRCQSRLYVAPPRHRGCIIVTSFRLNLLSSLMFIHKKGLERGSGWLKMVVCMFPLSPINGSTERRSQTSRMPDAVISPSSRFLQSTLRRGILATITMSRSNGACRV